MKFEQKLLEQKLLRQSLLVEPKSVKFLSYQMYVCVYIYIYTYIRIYVYVCVYISLEQNLYRIIKLQVSNINSITLWTEKLLTYCF